MTLTQVQRKEVSCLRLHITYMAELNLKPKPWLLPQSYTTIPNFKGENLTLKCNTYNLVLSTYSVSSVIAPYILEILSSVSLNILLLGTSMPLQMWFPLPKAFSCPSFLEKKVSIVYSQRGVLFWDI